MPTRWLTLTEPLLTLRSIRIYMKERDHQAHRQRADLNLWCGGTHPPTEVQVYYATQALRVFVYPESYNPHVGVACAADQIVDFLVEESYFAEPESIGSYALKALQSINKEEQVT